MSLKQLFPVIFGFLLLAACSGKDERPVAEAVSAFIKGNENVVSFGSLDLQSILNKAEYKSIPKIGNLIQERLGNVLNTKSPIYYVLEGPFDKNGNPASTYAFFDLTSKDSLVELLGSSGLYMEESGEMKYNLNGDISIGIRGKLAILVTRKEDYDGKKVLEAAFEKTTGDVAGGTTDKLLAKKNDVNLNVYLENLYGTSNTSLASLSEAKQKEIKSMMDDSYIHSDINFENGKMVFTSENIFSEALQKRMFFKQDGQANVLGKLGKGKACLGIASNFDMSKVESIIDDFAPELKDKLFSARAETALAAMILGDNPLTKVFSGVAGIVVVGDPRMTGFTPEVNFNLGLGSEGKPFLTAAASASSFGKRFSYVITDTDLIASSPNAGAGQSTLIIPSCGNNFGKDGITAFADFEDMDLKSFGLPMKYKYVGIMKNITFKMNNKGSELVINALDPNKNILKQLVDLYIQDIEKQVSAVAI